MLTRRARRAQRTTSLDEADADILAFLRANGHITDLDWDGWDDLITSKDGTGYAPAIPWPTTTFDWITDRVGTGGDFTDPRDVQKLVKDGVTAVIDCRIEAGMGWRLVTSKGAKPRYEDVPVTNVEARLMAEAGIAYLNLGIDDDHLPKPLSWVKEGVDFALSILADPTAKVVAHCAAGYNRGPSMALAILIALGHSPTEAEAMIRLVRPVGLAYKKDVITHMQTLGYTS